MKTLRSKTYPGVTWVPKVQHRLTQLADLKRRASKGRAAALRQASEPEVPPPPSLAQRLRKVSGRPAETIEEKMQRNAEEAHRQREVTALESAKADVPPPPKLGVYLRELKAGRHPHEAMAEARR